MEKIDFSISKPETAGCPRLESGKTLDLDSEAIPSRVRKNSQRYLRLVECKIRPHSD